MRRIGAIVRHHILDIQSWIISEREVIDTRLGLWVIDRLPRFMVRWAAIRLFVHGTTGPWSSTDPSQLSVQDALARWNIKHD